MKGKAIAMKADPVALHEAFSQFHESMLLDMEERLFGTRNGIPARTLECDGSPCRHTFAIGLWPKTVPRTKEPVAGYCPTCRELWLLR